MIREASAGALLMTLTTPKSKPAARNVSPMSQCVRGQTSDPLNTTVLPQASGIATERTPRITGAFHGAMLRTTPTGCLSAIAFDRIADAITSPQIAVVIAAASLSIDAAKATLKRPQAFSRADLFSHGLEEVFFPRFELIGGGLKTSAAFAWTERGPRRKGGGGGRRRCSGVLDSRRRGAGRDGPGQGIDAFESPSRSVGPAGVPHQEVNVEQARASSPRMGLRLYRPPRPVLHPKQALLQCTILRLSGTFLLNVGDDGRAHPSSSREPAPPGDACNAHPAPFRRPDVVDADHRRRPLFSSFSPASRSSRLHRTRSPADRIDGPEDALGALLDRRVAENPTCRATGAPAATSHSRMVLSQEPEASRPSGSMHSAATGSECPSRRAVSAPKIKLSAR